MKRKVRRHGARAPKDSPRRRGRTRDCRNRTRVCPAEERARPRSRLQPERVAAILDALAKTYPGVVCALNHTSAWELTVATILSAQCTDARVNLVTPALFQAYPTPQAMAAAALPELEEMIKPTGFFRNKAKSIQGAATTVVQQFGGKVPQTMEEMLQLPGVARKTANVVLGSWYEIAAGVVVDTHVLRLSRRLELTTNEEPVKVERRSDRDHSTGTLDRLLARTDPSRAADLRGAHADVRGLLAGTNLQCR